MVAIISHDAGGAEILSSWALLQTESFCVVAEGPARKIFDNKLGPREYLPFAVAIEQADWILCGTSWQSNLERLAISEAKEKGKKSVAFIDHWVNYQERFREGDKIILPDEIWVGDAEAKKIADLVFPVTPVLLQPNPYFDGLVRELEKVGLTKKENTGHAVLYVCEPIREHALKQHGDERYWGYTEEDALLFFLRNVLSIDNRINKISIRPHPSEDRDKYNWATENTAMDIVIGSKQTLLEEIISADIIVGCESMAMVVGLLAKKRVISSIPPGGKACALPQQNIEHLQIIVKKNTENTHA